VFLGVSLQIAGKEEKYSVERLRSVKQCDLCPTKRLDSLVRTPDVLRQFPGQLLSSLVPIATTGEVGKDFFVIASCEKI
jgi:hypothetical protein